MELNLLLTLDLREQAALQAALVTHGAPDALVTLALTGACRSHRWRKHDNYASGLLKHAQRAKQTLHPFTLSKER